LFLAETNLNAKLESGLLRADRYDMLSGFSEIIEKQAIFFFNT